MKYRKCAVKTDGLNLAGSVAHYDMLPGSIRAYLSAFGRIDPASVLDSSLTVNQEPFAGLRYAYEYRIPFLSINILNYIAYGDTGYLML